LSPDSVSYLRAVPDLHPAVAPAAEPVSFCSYCGEAPRSGKQDSSRVCTHCELGLLLRADPALAPSPKDAFFVCDERLLICAFSEAAERLLGVDERVVIDRPLWELVVAAAEEDRATRRVDKLLAAAAHGADAIEHAVVCPLNTFGVRYQTRIGTCGPPAAALVVLDDTV
jgi:PAS domain-containing protein